MELIQTVTVGAGGATSIDFTSVPQTYTDLLIFISGRSSTSGTYDWGVQVNSDASTSKPQKQLIGTGSSVASYNNTLTYAGYTGRVPIASDTANAFGNSIVYIPNYAGSFNKIWTADTVVESDATNPASGVASDLNCGSFGITAAITSLSVRYIVSGTMNAAQHTIVSLYGIKKG